MSTYDQRLSVSTKNELRLSLGYPPYALTPALGGEGVGREILLLLFEGLMQRGHDHSIDTALAQSFHLSEDLKTYTFQLRPSVWSNGMPVQAQDFEHAWKKMLSPDSHNLFSLFFYNIKNARLAKEGRCSLDEVGVHSLSEYQLRVELEQPSPYFLELLTEPLFSPINRHVDQQNPEWHKLEGERFVCNGPYLLKKNSPDQLFLEKNPFYWDKENVFIPKISTRIATPQQSIELFKKEEIDWLGSPFHAWDSSFDAVKGNKNNEVYLQDCLYWCALNTKFPLLSHIKFRQALSLVLDRQKIVEEIAEGQPAFSPLPSHYANYATTGSPRGEIHLAQKLFNEALQELKISKSDLPVFRLIFLPKKKRLQIIQNFCQQWKETLGIDVEIQICDFAEHYKKLVSGDFEMALMGWYSPIDHPLYVLNLFKLSCCEVNISYWENPEYIHLLDLFLYELDPVKQKELLAYAEAILIKEVPVIPLVYEKDKALKNKDLLVFVKRTSIDFKHAFYGHF